MGGEGGSGAVRSYILLVVFNSRKVAVRFLFLLLLLLVVVGVAVVAAIIISCPIESILVEAVLKRRKKEHPLISISRPIQPFTISLRSKRRKLLGQCEKRGMLIRDKK